MSAQQTAEQRCNVCRFCGKYAREDDQRLDLIHYGVRHYAHPDCLLKAKGADTWALLHDWQLDQFPALAAARAGLFDSLCEAIRSRKGTPSVSELKHDLDEDATCRRCGFDAAEWWHLERQKPKAEREAQPPCETEEERAKRWPQMGGWVRA